MTDSGAGWSREAACTLIWLNSVFAFRRDGEREGAGCFPRQSQVAGSTPTSCPLQPTGCWRMEAQTRAQQNRAIFLCVALLRAPPNSLPTTWPTRN